MSKKLKSYYLNNFEMKEKGKATFQSYIEEGAWDEDEEEEDETPLDDNPKEEVEKTASDFFGNLLEPRRLQGEEIIAEADSVLMYSEGNTGVSGHLFVTNFKISFVTADKSSYPDGDSTISSQRSKILSYTDIPLTCVDTVYQVFPGGKRKKLPPRVTISHTSENLEIHCKDFQVHVFGFNFAGKDQIKRVTDSISVHSFPERDDLLFAHEFGLNREVEEHHQPSETCEGEYWHRELERLHCQAMWRVSDANLGFKMSTSLPEYFVAPIHMHNADLDRAAAQYIDKRLPTWSYTYVNGASLLRMSQLIPESHFKSFEDNMLLAVRQSSGNDKDPFILDLGRQCPSLQDIRTSGHRLKKMIRESFRDFCRTDSSWMSKLESCQWLEYVKQCLNTANHVVGQLTRESQTVLLKEETGCDLVAVVSSLVQLQLDPECRTLPGFQALVHREWVLMGHPFQKRLSLLHTPAQPEQRVPVFLLFLDCVWQLLQQFPSSFAFTETYLTSLWDTAHVGIFDTFLFDSCWHRRCYLDGRGRALSLPSAWDWTFQMSEEQILLFNNPLYLLRTSPDLTSVASSAKSDLRLSGERLREKLVSPMLDSRDSSSDMFLSQETVLKPVVSSRLLKLWSQCYLRWIVPAQIVGGGTPAQYMQQCVLAEEVLSLQHRLQHLTQRQRQAEIAAQYTQINTTANNSLVKAQVRPGRPHSGLVFGSRSSPSISSQLSSVHITSSFPFSPGGFHQSQRAQLIGQLSEYLKETAIDHDYGMDEED